MIDLPLLNLLPHLSQLLFWLLLVWATVETALHNPEMFPATCTICAIALAAWKNARVLMRLIFKTSDQLDWRQQLTDSREQMAKLCDRN